MDEFDADKIPKPTKSSDWRYQDGQRLVGPESFWSPGAMLDQRIKDDAAHLAPSVARPINPRILAPGMRAKTYLEQKANGTHDKDSLDR